MKILFKLTSKREVVISLLKYNCFDYLFQVLFVNDTVWILLWILTLFSALKISILPALKYCDSQGLNARLKLIGEVKKCFFEKVTGPWNI